MISYKTVRNEGSCEQIIEKSRFITYVKPVECKESADLFIEEIKKKHRDATHNVPAMVIGDQFQLQWGSDDGEPQGTSGAPMVQYLVKEGITNVVLVVTRYFGGIKLGTGGLVRAYTGSAKNGIDTVGLCLVKERLCTTYEVSYPVFNKVQNFPFNFDAKISKMVYTDVVRFDAETEISDGDQLDLILGQLSGGTQKCINQQTCLCKVDI